MKTIKKTVREYYYSLEYTDAGTYTLNIPETGNYDIEMYGAGGGVCGSIHSGYGYNVYGTSSGGSGAGFKGNVALEAGTYTVIVGAYGANGAFGGTTSASSGTATILQGIIEAGGGSGATASNGSTGTPGVGGTLTILDSSKIVSSVISSDGNSGQFKNVSGLGGYIANCSGGLSLYDDSQTGYGAGAGKIESNPAYNAQDGYFKISYSQTPIYYEDVDIYKTSKKTERRYYKYDTSNPIYNYTSVGSLTNNNGVISGFSTSAYANITTESRITNIYNKAREEVYKITTGSNISSGQCIRHFMTSDGNGEFIYISNSTFGYMTRNQGAQPSSVSSSITISANTDYWVKLVATSDNAITLSHSTDGINYIQDLTYTCTVSANIVTSVFGFDKHGNSPRNIFGGSIDLKESYIKIDDSIVWQGVTYPIIEGDSSDYDFYKDVDVYKAVKF